MSFKGEHPIWSKGAQLQWLEGLSVEDLKSWLRKLVWTQDSHPLVPPSQSISITYFADVIGRGTSALTCKVREVVPSLLQEWGRNDPMQCLDDLLVLSALLRCAAAEATIAIIASERITGTAEEVELKKRCLSVLSGFGCSEHSAPLFYRHLEDINYSAYCFRALYRYKLSYAVATLPTVVAIHKAADKLQALKGVLTLLFFDYLNLRQRIALWRDIIDHTEPMQLEEMLRTLQSLGIVLSVNRHASQEIEVIYDYSVVEPKKAGEKVQIYDFQVTSLAAINRALEAFLTSSNRIAQAVGASP